jgi:transcriptional regulator GlxA family with amidase domain
VAGINRRALERGFRRFLGVSPGQYMTEVKLDHARKLLSQTDLRMWEIAEACQMTQDHFSYLFRTTTGQTPSAYRRTKGRSSVNQPSVGFRKLRRHLRSIWSGLRQIYAYDACY